MLELLLYLFLIEVSDQFMWRYFIGVFSNQIIWITIALIIWFWVGVLLLVSNFDLNFFFWFIEPNKCILPDFPNIEHVLVRHLNQRDGSKICIDTIALLGKFCILYHIYYLECEHWKAQHLFLRWVPRHQIIGQFNLSWWWVILVQIDFEDKKLFLLDEILLRWLRKPKCYRLRGGTRLESGPSSDGVPGVRVFVIERAVWIEPSL